MQSYAQNAEDVVLWRAFSKIDPAEGFYVDVGANHPIVDSVTKHFYDSGWHGINVEPVSPLAEQLATERPRDINLHCAVGAEEGTLTFHRVLDNNGLSTFDDEFAEGYRQQGMEVESSPVPVTTLRKIFDEHVEGPVHFLKIDVEGFEHEVISGADWTRHRPYVLVIEATTPEKWEDQLEAAGYRRVLDDGINYFFVAEEHSELEEPLHRPATVVDRYSPFEWSLRATPYRQLLSAYAVDPIVGEMLRNVPRRRVRRLAPAARQLVETLVRRDDLVHTFVKDGQVNHFRLLSWALDVDPEIDPDIAALQAQRGFLDDIRRQVER